MNQTNGFVNILLPQVREGDGYTVQFVNETNQTDVFAKSEAFRIEAGTRPNTTSSGVSSSASQTASSKTMDLGASSESKTSSGNPFASSSAAAKADSDKSGASQVVPAALGAGAVAAAVFALL